MLTVALAAGLVLDGAAAFDERLRLDVESMGSMSPPLDLNVMLWIVGSVVKRSGA